MYKRCIKEAYELSIEASDYLLRALEYDFEDVIEIDIVNENVALAVFALIKVLSIIANGANGGDK